MFTYANRNYYFCKQIHIMVERIKTLIEKQKLTATQFAEEIGVQRSAVSHLLSGRNKPSLDFMLKIKNRFPEISLDWLLLGQGKMKEIAMKEDVLDENSMASLFKTETKTVLEEGVLEGKATIASEFPLNMAQSEDDVAYRATSKELTESPKKMIFIYSDNTFKIFDTR